ncbi:MAG TPA: hypothetical protein VF525_05230 [Pyrinomonadaceae bacterium]|jgi:hypothetical protein
MPKKPSPVSEPPNVRRFAAVQEWTLEVSYVNDEQLGHGSRTEIVNATFALKFASTGSGGLIEWAGAGSGAATYEENQNQVNGDTDWKLSAGGSGAQTFADDAAELALFPDGTYSLNWPSVEYEIKSKFTHPHQASVEQTRTTSAGGTSVLHKKLPADALNLSGKLLRGQAVYRWKLTPAKLIPYKEIELYLRLFIPAPLAVLDKSIGTLVAPVPFAMHTGDNRSFSYDSGTHRAYARVVVTCDPNNPTGVVKAAEADFGQTHTYLSNPVHAEHVNGKPYWFYDWRPPFNADNVPGLETHLTRTEKNLGVKVMPALPNMISVRLTVQAGIPSAEPITRVSAPDIDADITVIIQQHDEHAEYTIAGDHDGFPAYELYINGQPAYQYDPVAHNVGPEKLYPPMDVKVARGWTKIP